MIPTELKTILAEKGYPTSASIARATGRSNTLVCFMLHGIRPCPKLRREVKFMIGVDLDDYIPNTSKSPRWNPPDTSQLESAA